jgi:hypothetical protein
MVEPAFELDGIIGQYFKPQNIRDFELHGSAGDRKDQRLRFRNQIPEWVMDCN